MSKSGINIPRFGCQLHGALSTVAEIKGAVPIVHSTSGCAIQNYLSAKAAGQVSGYIDGFEIPCTNVIERHVVFGGTSRLREEINNTIKVVKGDLYVVLSGCEAAMVGDDIVSMANEVKKQGERIVPVLTAGFKGRSLSGYEAVLSALIDEFFDNTQDVDNRLVNIFGIVPGDNVFWQGDLKEIKRILEGFGLRVNTLVGYDSGIEQLKSISKAALNISFSKWGSSLTEKLAEKYNTPYINYNYIPSGYNQVVSLAEDIKERINLEDNVVSAFLGEEKVKLDYTFAKLKQIIYSNRIYSKNIGIAADEAKALQIIKLAEEYFNSSACAVIITDGASETEDFYIAEDRNKIADIIKNNSVDIMFASSLENEAAKAINASNVAVSYPVYNNVAFDKTYSGTEGAIRFAEDYINAALASESLRAADRIHRLNEINIF